MEPRSLLSRLLEMAFMFLIISRLLKSAVRILTEIWPALAVIATVALIIAIIWRICKHIWDIGK